MQGVIALLKCMDVLTREDGGVMIEIYCNGMMALCFDGVVGGQRMMGT